MKKPKVESLKSAKVTCGILLFVVLLMSSIAQAGTPMGSQPTSLAEGLQFAPREFIVKFGRDVRVFIGRKEGIVTAGIRSIDALNERFSVVSAEKLFPQINEDPKARALYASLGLGRIYKYTVSREIDVPFVVKQYQKDPNVELAEPNYIGHAHPTTPDDPSFGWQWGLYNDGTNPPPHPGTADADIDAPEAWDIERGSASVVVAILDTGIDWDHPDLDARIWSNPNEMAGNGADDDGNGYIDDIRGWDFTTSFPGTAYPNGDDNPMDDNGHGTVNAGIVGAEVNNNTGVAGVDWYCKLMPVKVLEEDGSGWYSHFAKGVYYAACNGAKVINMSLGGTNPGLTSLKPAVDFAYGVGCVIVASIGNDNNNTVYFPAGYDKTIAVGATDTDDTRCVPPDWSHISPTAGSNFGDHIDVVAPGNYIYSTDWNNAYNYWGGTSEAAPFVSGLASLLFSQDPSRTNAQIRRIIRLTAEDQGGLSTEDGPGWDQYYGYGRINAHCALLGVPDAAVARSASSEATAYNNGRRMVRDSNGVRHLVYELTYILPSPFFFASSVMYTRSPDGIVWSHPVPIATGYDPAIAIDRDDNLGVVYQEVVPITVPPIYPDVLFICSADGGSTWSDPFNVSQSHDIGSYHPAIDVDYYNHWHVVWDEAGEIWWCLLDGCPPGADPKQNISRTPGNSEYPSIANTTDYSSENIHVVWTDDSEDYGYPTPFIAYRRGWLSWYPLLAASPLDVTSGTTGQFASISVGLDDNPHVVWTSGQPEGDVFHATSPDGGLTFKSPNVIAITGVYFTNPSVANTCPNCVHVVWEDDHEVYHSYSTDDGATWVDPQVVSADDAVVSRCPNLAYKKVLHDFADIVWTEGNSAPYTVMYLRKAAPISAAVPDTVGIYRPSTRTFYLKNEFAGGPADFTFTYGAAGDTPLVGNWDGDGTDTIGVYRASTRTFYLKDDFTGGIADQTFTYGAAGDTPLVGDWDGVGGDTVGVYRPSTRTFYLKDDFTGGIADQTFTYGAAGDTPLVGDWDGDGTDTIGVYRASTRTFYLKNTFTGGPADFTFTYGAAGDTPLVGRWQNGGGLGSSSVPMSMVSSPVVLVIPNPVTAGGEVTFQVMGAGVDAVKVSIYDLGGGLVYQSELVSGQSVTWDLQAEQDTPVANGIYLCSVSAKVGEKLIKTEVGKLLILR